MIRKRFVCLLVAIVAVTLVNTETTAFASTEAPGTDSVWLDDGTPEPPNPSPADASELATLRDLSSVDPRNVYSVEDLEQYGTFSSGSSYPMAENSSEWITAGNCTYRQRVDDPHWSRNSISISVHGYWEKRSGSSCPTYANVDTYLQANWCNPFGCAFVTIASDSRDVRAGGGSGRRGNARTECRDARLVAYRGAVDIDLIGQNDPPGLTYSKRPEFNCWPA